jgi:hypothetical protein
MEVFDLRFGLVAAGAAAVSSERVRRTVGRGLGYAATRALAVGRPMVDAGRDIFEEARAVTDGHGSTKTRSSRTKTTRPR